MFELIGGGGAKYLYFLKIFLRPPYSSLNKKTQFTQLKISCCFAIYCFNIRRLRKKHSSLKHIKITNLKKYITLLDC